MDEWEKCFINTNLEMEKANQVPNAFSHKMNSASKIVMAILLTKEI